MRIHSWGKNIVSVTESLAPPSAEVSPVPSSFPGRSAGPLLSSATGIGPLRDPRSVEVTALSCQRDPSGPPGTNPLGWDPPEGARFCSTILWGNLPVQKWPLMDLIAETWHLPPPMSARSVPGSSRPPRQTHARSQQGEAPSSHMPHPDPIHSSFSAVSCGSPGRLRKRNSQDGARRASPAASVPDEGSNSGKSHSSLRGTLLARPRQS